MSPPATLTETAPSGTPPCWALTQWQERFGVVAGITGRAGDFNLGYLTADPASAVTERWRRLAAAFQPGFTALAWGLQTHGTEIRTHGGGVPGWRVMDGVDGHLTREAGLLLAVTVADCVPVYLIHQPSRTIGLLHAGWRGTAAGMLEAGITRLAELAMTSPANIVMHCGVAICGTCYEVGPEVHHALGAARPRGPLDLRAHLTARAQALGVREVSASSWCAAHDDTHFFSHRRSGGRDGRMVAYLGMPLA